MGLDLKQTVYNKLKQEERDSHFVNRSRTRMGREKKKKRAKVEEIMKNIAESETTRTEQFGV